MIGKYLPQNILYQASRDKLQNNLKFMRNLCVGDSTGGGRILSRTPLLRNWNPNLNKDMFIVFAVKLITILYVYLLNYKGCWKYF